MATVTKTLYEGMFLVDTALAASDWNGVVESIESILKRVDAEVISLRKWDERRLAYDVDKLSRGTYMLAYFKCDGEKIQEIEKTVQLSEQIMRVLILNAEHMTQEDIERDTPATKAEKVQEDREAAAEAKIAEAKAAEGAAPVAAAAPADAGEPSEDAAAAVETESAEVPVAPVEKKEDAATEPAEATSPSEEPAAEAAEDEPKAAE